MKRFLAAVVSAAILMTGCGSTAKAVEEASTEAVVSENKAVSFKDNEIIGAFYSIKITDSKVIKPGDKGNENGEKPVIAFWYDVTNTSGIEISPQEAWEAAVTLAQDKALSETAIPDESLVGTEFEKVPAGETASSAVAYELEDDGTVTLTAKSIKDTSTTPETEILGTQEYEAKQMLN